MKDGHLSFRNNSGVTISVIQCTHERRLDG